MRRTIIFVFLSCLLTAVSAQTAKDEIKKNVRLSASNYLAYRGPQRPLTPVPKGLKPFYISHYGRHGSRYLNNAEEYDYLYNVLRHANELSKLTEQGKIVLQRISQIREEARGRLGELTPLGAEQQRQIAQRMYERFPEVFQGDAYVDARSTTTIRCILSMENAVHQLLRKNPKLRVTHDASRRDMSYLRQDDNVLWGHKTDLNAAEPVNRFCEQQDHSEMLMKRLFNDPYYIEHELNPTRFNYFFFKVASNVQNTELRTRLTLYDMLSDEEIYHNWLSENARAYAGFAAFPLNGGKQPFSQRNLLRRIIAEADSCIQLKSPGASLRFGHETIVLPLVCLLDLNNYGQQIADVESIEKKGWHNYDIYPMSCNVQFVFYRRNADDQNVVFKVFLNEDEATLPLPKDLAPFYRWTDFKSHYLELLDSYKEEN